MKTPLVISAICLCPVFVYGGLLRVEVTGHITQTPWGSYTGSGYAAIPNGSIMTGYCVYDTSSPDLDTTTAYHGKYELKEISVQIGSFVFSTCEYTTGNPTFQVWRTDETYLAQCPAQMGIYVNSNLISYGGEFTLLDLCNASQGRPDDLFPTSVPSDISYFYYRNQFRVSGNFFNASGVLDSFSIVPEPGTVILLFAGMGWLKGCRNK